MNWNSTEILASAPNRSHLNLLEQSFIHTLKPTINRTDKVPTINPQWTSILPRVAASKPRPAGIKLEFRDPFKPPEPKPTKSKPRQSTRATRSTCPLLT